MQLEIQLTKPQSDFRHSAALYRGFVGGRGAGKSFCGAYDLQRRAKPGRLYGMYAPTYPMLRDATLRSFLEIGERMHFIKNVTRSDMIVTLGNGAEVLCRSLDDPERARGPNLSGAYIDEASLCKREAYDIIIACLRQSGEQGWLSTTFTPKGRSHWTYDVFGQNRQDTAIFRSRTDDNPFNPQGFADTLRGQYISQLAAQEVGGEFVEIEGGVCNREWFPVVDVGPVDGKRVRAWDFAATEASVKSENPDYTVGTLLVAKDGIYYVSHVIRARIGAGSVENLVIQTAQADGKSVPIAFEQEPGSSGKLFVHGMVRRLAGWTSRAIPATGSKLQRVMPFLAQAEVGNVKLVRGEWCPAWLDELASLPNGAHDDQSDSVALGFQYLTSYSGWVR